MATKLKMEVDFAKGTFWISFPKTCRTIAIGNRIKIIEHDWRNEWKGKFPFFLNQIQCFDSKERGRSGQVTFTLVENCTFMK